MNKKTLFNDGWMFAKTHLEATPEIRDYQPVALPHDWLIYQTEALYEDSIGWYRRPYYYHHATVPNVSLYFEGVYMDSVLYVNGQIAFEWKYGYSSFEADISPYLHVGENMIELKVTHQAPNSRWYSGAGIYRDVYLIERADDYITTHGVYVHTRKLKDDWVVELETTVKRPHQGQLIQTITKAGMNVAEAIVPVTDAVVAQSIVVPTPHLWSSETPHLYELTTKLVIEGTLVDQQSERFGFKDVVMDPSVGLIVNGKQMKIQGVCEHHDLGALGARFNKEAMRYRLQLLKEMGVNGIRTAHNMPAKAVMELCDEMGFFVVSEAFDMWERQKTPYDYGRFFKDWVNRDVKSWIERDRNHVSLLMWSIGNEIYDTHASERGQAVTKQLMALVAQYDPKENARPTIGSNFMPWKNAQACADLVKLAGYNYAEKYYRAHHLAHPDWVIYGSETASVVQSRGVYHFPYDKSILADDDEQCSALGNSATSWGATSPEFCITTERDTPFSLGQFIWTGFDYIGEPTPYHTKNAYFGQLDTATFKKDTYFIYQAGWTNYKDAPMIHLFPYWDFNPGQTIDVRVATNAPIFKLFLNGTLISHQTIDHVQGLNIVPTIPITFEPGELTAVAYDENETIIATDRMSSFGDAKVIDVSANKMTMEANNEDLVFVTIQMRDEVGEYVRNANNRVAVKVTGAGCLVGLDNGDSTDRDPYKGLSRRLFSGKLMALIQATDEFGPITVEVTSKGMRPEVLTLEACASGTVTKQSVYSRNLPMPLVLGNEDEVPIRKIELVPRGGKVLNQDVPTVAVDYHVYPPEATYHAIEFSVVTDGGAKTTLAALDEEEGMVKVTARGDGNFRLRATSRNGSKKVRLISELDFTATDLGIAYKDPYQLISGSLYDDHIGEVSSGNERGFATGRDGETVIGFSNIDFGAMGSNQITLPIFTLNDEKYRLQIWDGKPATPDATLVCDGSYQKASIWNVYQPETYQLAKRLTGIHDIYFVTEDKMHVKGLQFIPYNRKDQVNKAVEADAIYGDTFTMQEDRVAGIGNNVSLTFNDFDFGEAGVTHIGLTGHSPIDKNTIHIRFSDGATEEKQVIEFTETEGLTEKDFQLDPVYGKQVVTFIFLPGSSFDFHSFRFW